MALRLILALAIVSWAASAQQKTVSSSTRPGVNDNASGALEGTRPESVLKIIKAKGAVKSVDVRNRSVLLDLGRRGELQLAFSQPAGREQIKLAKKAARRLGTTRITLEELQADTKVRVQYYPQLAQLLEVVVD